MEQNQESYPGYLEQIATLTDSIEKIFPTAQSAIIFELAEQDFENIRSYFKQINKDIGRFKIDISGVEVIFMLKGFEPPVIEPPVIEEVKKVGKLKKIFNLLSGKKSS